MAPIAGEAKCSAACGSAGAAMTAWNSSHSETKPLSGGKAEIGERAHQEEDGGARHAMDETAQPVEIAPAGGVQHGAGAEEEQAT